MLMCKLPGLGVTEGMLLAGVCGLAVCTHACEASHDAGQSWREVGGEEGESGTDREEAGDQVFSLPLSEQNSKGSENSKSKLAFQIVMKVYLSGWEGRSHIFHSLLYIRFITLQY